MKISCLRLLISVYLHTESYKKALLVIMKFAKRLSIIILSVAFAAIPTIAQKSKDVHREMHSHLLANAKVGIDKSVIQSYIKQEVENKEIKSGFEGLSEESIAMISDLLDEARSHTGKKYVYGSKGPNTFDCSGFTGYVFNQFGINIGTSSRGQYTLGTEVSKKNLRPGDLVFFTSPRSGKGVGHVGIVVSADHENQTFKFIHASVSKGIRISDSSESYYVKRYIGAKRIINE